MRVWVEYDSESNIATIRHAEAGIQSEADVQEWRNMVLGELAEAIPEGRKTWILVDFDSFKIDPNLIDQYGKVATEVRAYAKQVIRYNCDDFLTKISVYSKATHGGYLANICNDREEALKLVKKLQTADQK